jgi:hypothetical protein
VQTAGLDTPPFLFIYWHDPKEITMPYKDAAQKRANNAAWRAAHPDYNWHRDNPEKSKTQSDTYRKEHLTQYAEYQRNSRGRRPRETLVEQARGRAKRDGLPCDITVELLEWPTHCPVLGVELDYTQTPPGERRIRTNSPTLDRRVNKLGYVRGNVFVISHRANRIKSDATAAELKAVAEYAAITV